jgi:predicted transcriptional regulator
MPKSVGSGLSRREREILDILYRKGKATVAEVLDEISDPITYSAVRSTLRILVEKGHAAHKEEGKKYVYMPIEPRTTAARSALDQVVHTFFSGNFADAVKAFLNSDKPLAQDELDDMARMIDAARRTAAESERKHE